MVSGDNAKILIDAGLPGKKIDAALQEIDENPRDLKGIFITHEHSDHIKGVGVISRKYDIPIYANADTWSAMEQSLGKIKEHNIKIIDKRSITEIEDMSIKAFNIPHDAVSPMGYTVTDGLKSGLTVFIAFGFAFIFACTDEIHQLFVPGRSGRIGDVLIDSRGAVVGGSIIRIIRMCRV